MSLLAANPADCHHLSSCLVERAIAGLSARHDGGDLHRSCGGHADLNRTAIRANFRSQYADENLALARVCRYGSRHLLGPSFGAFPGPGGTRPCASHSAPLRGLGSFQNKFRNHAKKRHANFLRAPP